MLLVVDLAVPDLVDEDVVIHFIPLKDQDSLLPIEDLGPRHPVVVAVEEEDDEVTKIISFPEEAAVRVEVDLSFARMHLYRGYCIRKDRCSDL